MSIISKVDLHRPETCRRLRHLRRQARCFRIKVWLLEIFVLLQYSACVSSMFLFVARIEFRAFERPVGIGQTDIETSPGHVVLRVVSVFIVRPFAVIDVAFAVRRTNNFYLKNDKKTGRRWWRNVFLRCCAHDFVCYCTMYVVCHFFQISTLLSKDQGMF